MTTEQRRLDLYNGLTEIFGADRADTLMSHLPTHQYDDLATQKDISGMSTRIDGIVQRLDGVDKRLDGVDKRLDGVDKRLDGVDKRLEGVEKGLAELNKRFDRLILTLMAGLFVVVGAMLAQGLF